MQRVIALLKLIRVHNCLMVGIGVWLGGYLADGPPFSDRLLLASIAMGLVGGAGNAFNDFLDIESDRINHPRRPLPRQEIPLYQVLILVPFLYLAGMVVSVFVNRDVFMIVTGSGVLLLVYNVVLKKVAFWGNLTVAVLGGLTLITGGLAVSPENMLALPGPVIPAVFAMVLHLGREGIKDLADISGDRRAGFRTLPMLVSEKVMLILIFSLFTGLVIITLVPIYYGWYRSAYGVIAVGLVNLPLLTMMIYLWISERKDRFKYAARIIKLLMLFGLLAFFLGKK